MANPTKPESTSVATTDKRRILDLDATKTEQRFVEAFQKGQLDKLAPNEQTMFLMAFGRKIGVRAELGELMLYQGKPYITIAGRVRIAHQSGLLAGLQPRPATSVERMNFGATDDEVLWVCDAYRVGAPRGFRGWGVVNVKTDRNPVAKQFPREMAKKRAKYDALALAFPPDESMGELHKKYIEQAEELAVQQMNAAARFVRQPDDMPEIEGEEIGAVVSDTSDDDQDTPNDPDHPQLREDSAEVFGEGSAGPVLPGEVEAERAASGELPLSDRPKRRNAVAEGR
jgi:hypothetical protein